MAYTIQALIARQGVFPSSLPEGLVSISLPQGLAMIPLGSLARKQYEIPFCPLTDEGPVELPAGLVTLCQGLSLQGVVAYIEAELFGGMGMQAGTIFSQGQQASVAFVQSDAINAVLRSLQVEVAGSRDEFEALGLGQCRVTDDWLK